MADPGAPVRVPAPAKLNLYLHVLCRRPDGYHRIDSLVAFASVGDVVEVAAVGADPHPDPLPQAGEGVGGASGLTSPACGRGRPLQRPGEGGAAVTFADRPLSLLIDGPFAGDLADAGDRNLVLRAARALAAHAGIAPRAAIRLSKHLPVASGLGGGSADAAAALTALTRLWRLDIAAADLARIALGLGADVPMCLAGTAAFVGGIGEEIVRAPDLPEAGVVLVNPLRPLPTARVFAARTGPFSQPARFSHAPRDAKALADLLRARDNDLTAAAIALEPAVAAVLAALAATPGCLLARMSGSGATGFGLFADVMTAKAAAADLAARAPRWWVRAAALGTQEFATAEGGVGTGPVV